jgi:hypothetical protein
VAQLHDRYDDDDDDDGDDDYDDDDDDDEYVSLRSTRFCEPYLEMVGIERNIKIHRSNEDVFVTLNSFLLRTGRCLLRSTPIPFHSSRKVKGISVERIARERF